jgi:hypothetical protein
MDQRVGPETTSAQTLPARRRVLRIVGLAIPASTVLLLAAGLGLLGGVAPAPPPIALVGAFAAVALAAVVLGPLIARRRMLAALESGPQDATVNAEARAAWSASTITTFTILGLAFAELPGMLGFVLYVLGSSSAVFLAFAAASFLGYAYIAPRGSDWETWVEAAQPAPAAPPPL